MLPVNTSLAGCQLDKTTNTFIPIYSFQDPNSADFAYNFNGGLSGMPYNGNCVGCAPTGFANCPLSTSGLGYFGSNFIASPKYICHPFNQNNAFSENFPNWLSTINAQIDLRGFYVSCGSLNGQNTFNRIIPEQDTLGSISSYTNTPVAFTTEALYYAQSGYFVTVVMVQWSNVFACKSRKVHFYSNLVLIDLLWYQQTHVRWCRLRNCLVHFLAVRARR